jgi:MYXO-CTERM domain-containing protein
MKAMIFLAGAALAAPAMADVYTDSASFLAAIEPGYYYNNFTGVPTGAQPSLSYSSGGFSYTISTGPGALSGLYNDTGLVSTDNAQDVLYIEFTSGNVTAVGGNFWATDISFFPIAATVAINLSDGTSVSFNSTSANDFRGFTSNVTITSMTIDAIDGVAFAWTAMDNLYVGMVPAPGAMALLGLGGLAASRRRR